MRVHNPFDCASRKGYAYTQVSLYILKKGEAYQVHQTGA
jgi:hypothetical protein